MSIWWLRLASDEKKKLSNGHDVQRLPKFHWITLSRLWWTCLHQEDMVGLAWWCTNSVLTKVHRIRRHMKIGEHKWQKLLPAKQWLAQYVFPRKSRLVLDNISSKRSRCNHNFDIHSKQNCWNHLESLNSAVAIAEKKTTLVWIKLTW